MRAVNRSTSQCRAPICLLLAALILLQRQCCMLLLPHARQPRQALAPSTQAGNAALLATLHRTDGQRPYARRLVATSLLAAVQHGPACTQAGITSCSGLMMRPAAPGGLALDAICTQQPPQACPDVSASGVAGAASTEAHPWSRQSRPTCRRARLQAHTLQQRLGSRVQSCRDQLHTASSRCSPSASLKTMQFSMPFCRRQFTMCFTSSWASPCPCASSQPEHAGPAAAAVSAGSWSGVVAGRRSHLVLWQHDQLSDGGVIVPVRRGPGHADQLGAAAAAAAREQGPHERAPLQRQQGRLHGRGRPACLRRLR